jgi:methylglutaconyl-CoA hydratase
MPYTTLLLEYDSGIATITFNRPDRRNAISSEMIAEFPDALSDVEHSGARVLVITGAGKAFCAGMDLADLRRQAQQTPGQHLEDSQRMSSMFRRLYFFPRPVIAAVNGPAIAGGTGFASLADFTLAVPEATFGYTEVRIGFMPAVVSVFLRRQVGAKQARDLLLTGRLFDAAEAHRMGLVTEVVPAADLIAKTQELAVSLVALSPTSLGRTKRLLLEFERESIEQELATAIRESAAIRQTEDFREGLSAFLEKRAPRWQGK